MFLPAFLPTNPTNASIVNYVYTIEGSFGTMFAKEPSIDDSSKIVQFSGYEVRFHWPAEHLINGTQFDLEMQIFMKVTLILFILTIGYIWR